MEEKVVVDADTVAGNVTDVIVLQARNIDEKIVQALIDVGSVTEVKLLHP